MAVGNKNLMELGSTRLSNFSDETWNGDSELPSLETLLAPKPLSRRERGDQFFMSLPKDLANKALLLEPDLYDCVMLAARESSGKYGLLLRWLSPHTISFRGAPIIKQG